MVIALALPGVAHASLITVGTFSDVVGSPDCSLRDAVISANENASSGGCTGGEAVFADTIVLATGTYTLDEPNATPGGEDDSLTGDLDLSGDVVIWGEGIDKTIVDANGIDRVFNLTQSSTDAEFEDLAITGGHAPDGAAGSPGGDQGAGPSQGGNGSDGARGGGILSEGNLDLTNVRVFGNHAGDGGAGGIGEAAGDGAPGSPGSNSQGGTGGTGGRGGGVEADGGELHATDSTFQDNTAGDGGAGGAAGNAGAGGPGTPGGAGGVSFGGQGGFSGEGGGIHALSAVLVLAGSSVMGNTAGAAGAGGAGGAGGTGGTGGPSSGGSGGLSHGGGAVFGGFGGGLSLSDTTASFSQSTVADNHAGSGGSGGIGGHGGAGGAGASGAGAGGPSLGGGGGPGGAFGGIGSSGGDVQVELSTVSDNIAGNGGAGAAPGASGAGSTPGSTVGGEGGVGGFTGGLGQGGGPLNIQNTTVSGNATGAGGDGGPGGAGPTSSTGGGGGTGGNFAGLIAGGVTGTVTHATIAGNLTAPGGAGGFGGTGTTHPAGLTGAEGSVGGVYSDDALTLSNTLISANDDAQCAGAGFTDGGNNLSFPEPAGATCVAATVHDDPVLGPLASNGGPTKTRALGSDSAAIDAAGTGGPCLLTDQRDIPRPRGAACDIGAFELAAPSATTGAAGGVTATKASLAGLADPNSIATTYRFAFGTSSAYGSLTSPVSAGSGTTDVAAAATLTGLQPKTLYHYRLEATNSDGTALGADGTFTTSASLRTIPKALPLPAPVLPAVFEGVSISTKKARADKKGRVSVKLRCPAGAVVKCKGKLSLTTKIKVKRKGRKAKTKTVKLGSVRFSIAAGKSKTVKVKLSKANRKLLKARKKLKVALAASATDNRGGKAKVKKGKLSLKPPKAKKK